MLSCLKTSASGAAPPRQSETADNRGKSSLFRPLNLGPLVIPFVRDFSLPTLYIFSTSLYANIYIHFEPIEEHRDKISADAALDSFDGTETFAAKLGQATFRDSHDSLLCDCE